MPLDEGDVLNILNEPVVKGMDFWVGPVHISGNSYGVVRDNIRADNILVVGGSQNLAFYDSQTNILTTQAVNPPPDLGQRALLLHECTHALIDVFDYDVKVTRHIDELSAYLAQWVYTMRSDPSTSVGPNNPPWYAFFQGVFTLIKNIHLDTVAGNGTHIGLDTLEPLRVQLAALPGVNYGSFRKDSPTGADGLTKTNPLVFPQEETSTRSSTTSREAYPDRSDDSLIRMLQEHYDASDVAGYGARLKALRREFALCSLGRARELSARLATRRRGDRLSELFHDRLSTAGRALLLKVLRDRR